MAVGAKKVLLYWSQKSTDVGVDGDVLRRTEPRQLVHELRDERLEDRRHRDAFDAVGRRAVDGKVLGVAVAQVLSGLEKCSGPFFS